MLVRRDALSLVAGAQLAQRLPDPARSAGHEIAAPNMVHGAGDVTAAHLGAGAAGVLSFGPHIDDDHLVSAQNQLDQLARRPVGPEPVGGERGLLDRRIGPGRRSVLGQPFLVAAVQQVDLGVTEAVQYPGEEGGVEIGAGGVRVDHHRPLQREPDSGEERCVRLCRQDVRRHAAVGGPQVFVVQVDRSGNVPLEISDEVGSQVDNGDGFVIGEQRGQLVGGDQLGELVRRGSHHRQLRKVAPLLKRAVIHPGLVAEEAGGEPDEGRLLADVAVSDDLIPGLGAGGEEHLTERLQVPEPVGLLVDDSDVRDVRGTGDMSGPGHAMTAACAAIKVRSSGVDDGHPFVSDPIGDPIGLGDHGPLRTRCDGATGRDRRGVAGDRMARRPPGIYAAVEDRGPVAETQVLEGQVHTGRERDPAVCEIKDDAGAVGDAELLER